MTSLVCDQSNVRCKSLPALFPIDSIPFSLLGVKKAIYELWVEGKKALEAHKKDDEEDLDGDGRFTWRMR